MVCHLDADFICFDEAAEVFLLGHRPVSVARRKAPYRFLPVLCSFLLDEPVHLVCQMLGGGSGRCIQKKTPHIVSRLEGSILILAFVGYMVVLLG